MPKINVPGFSEGSLISKDNLLDVKNEIEKIDYDIDGQNIREEGLDRRVFDEKTYTGNVGNTVRATNGRCDASHLTGTWQQPKFNLDISSMGGSAHSIHPVMVFPWNPEYDEHVVIRVSMSINSSELGKPDLNPRPVLRDEMWDFGMLIYQTDGHSTPSVPPVGYNNHVNPGVFPYQRVVLSPAFSDLAHIGVLSADESMDYIVFAEEVRTIDGPFKTFFETGEDMFPYGQWNQYGYNRRARMDQAITLVAAGSSSGSGPTGTRQFITLGERQNVVVAVYFRSRSPSNESFTHECRIRNLNMSHQIYRR